MILCQKISKPQLIAAYHAEEIPSGRSEAKGTIISVLVLVENCGQLIKDYYIRIFMSG